MERRAEVRQKVLPACKTTITDLAVEYELHIVLPLQEYHALLLNDVKTVAHLARDWSNFSFHLETSLLVEGELPSNGQQLAPGQGGAHWRQSISSHFVGPLSALLAGQFKDSAEEPTPEQAAPAREMASEDALDLLQSVCLALTDSDNIRPADSQTVLLKILTGLSADLEHWKEYQQLPTARPKLHLLLNTWLSGALPPARCAAISDYGEKCIFQAMPDSGMYCSPLHGCCFPNGCPQHRASAPAGIMFCEEHRCHETTGECLQPCMGISQYCKGHSCFICL
eukprot:scaffold371465_cov53-Prasinocladus_malaysianus.AAC.1